MAVLPTPASPMRTGLFLVRRDRMRTTRRISSSRPMTGSSLPSLASLMRSREYLERASTVSSGLALVTWEPPRSSSMAFTKFTRVILYSANTRPRGESDGSLVSAQKRWSTLTYSSCMRFASSWASLMTWARRWVIIILLGSMPGPDTEGRLRSISSRATSKACTWTPIRCRILGTIPLSWRTRASARWPVSTS